MNITALIDEAQAWATFNELNDYWYHCMPYRIFESKEEHIHYGMPTQAEYYEGLPEEQRLNWADDYRKCILADGDSLIKLLEKAEEYELCAKVRKVTDNLYKEAFMLYMKLERHEFHSEIDNI